MNKFVAVFLFIFILTGMSFGTSLIVNEVLDDLDTLDNIDTLDNGNLPDMSEEEFEDLISEYPEDVYEVTPEDLNLINQSITEVLGEEVLIEIDQTDILPPLDIESVRSELKNIYVEPSRPLRGDYNTVRGGLER